MNIRQTLFPLINDSLKSLGLSISPEKVVFVHPTELSHGDYSCNVALGLSKEQKIASRELADKIVANIKKLPAEIEKVEVAGPGFINFYLSKKFFAETIAEILKKGDKYGSSKIGGGKKVVVEYSSPNIAKPFTIGHLRSTIIGDSIANILTFRGYKVFRDNHLGDWGTQFGKQILAIKKWGNEEELRKSQHVIKDLVALYVKFHEEVEKDKDLDDEARGWFLKLEKGDKEAKKIWKECVGWSMVEFEKIYARLGVKFDTFYGEAFFEDKMTAVVEEVKDAGITKESEGALLVFFPDEKYPPLMILKKDGATIYATRDLATDKFRIKKYGKYITIINEVGTEQTLYFKQIFETEKILGWFEDGQRVHVSHGLYRFKEGKMSTRKGNAIWLDEILDEAVKRAAEINDATAEDVGIGAIKFNDLKRESSNDIIFDWNEIVNIKGDSGPYLQYSNTRANSVLEKAKAEKIKRKVSIPNSVGFLERTLYKFPEIIERASIEYAPHYIAFYLIELAGVFNNFYAKTKIIDKENSDSPYRIALTEAFAMVMSNGLNLLGIKVPEKM